MPGKAKRIVVKVGYGAIDAPLSDVWDLSRLTAPIVQRQNNTFRKYTHGFKSRWAHRDKRYGESKRTWIRGTCVIGYPNMEVARLTPSPDQCLYSSEDRTLLS
jgi:hypothetical protein